MEDLQENGVWWLPNNPDRKVGGTLDFSPKSGASLLITPPFANSIPFALRDVGENIQVIHGEIKAQEVTLYDSWTSGVNGNSQTVRSRYIFLRAHLTKDDCEFNKIKVALTYLPEFCNHSKLSGSLQLQAFKRLLGQEQTNHEATIKVESQDPIPVGECDGDKYSVQYGWKQSGDQLRSMTIEESCYLVIKLKKPSSISALIREKVHPMRNLITLATNEQNEFTELFVENPKIIDHRGKSKKIKVLLQTETRKTSKPNLFMWTGVLFRLKDVNENKLNGWLEISKKYQPVVNIIFGQLYSSSSSLENGLLNIVTAAEAYHQRRFDTHNKPPDDWLENVRVIINNLKETTTLNKSELNRVKQSLLFSNQKELMLRLKEILHHSTQLDRMPNSEWWGKEITDYRNSLAHYNPKHPKLVDLEDEKAITKIFYLTRSLSLVLLCCLMLDMGFSAKEVKEMTQEKSNFKIVYNRLRDFYSTEKAGV